MYGDDVDHQHYHDHLGVNDVYRYDRDRQRRDLSFYDFYGVLMAVKGGKNKTKKLVKQRIKIP
jgi:hypothetical protein